MAVGDEVYDRETGIVFEIVWDGGVRNQPTPEWPTHADGMNDMVKHGGHQNTRYQRERRGSLAHLGPKDMP